MGHFKAGEIIPYAFPKEIKRAGFYHHDGETSIKQAFDTLEK